MDERPLRKTTARDFRQQMAKLEKARAQLRVFEHEEQPAFARWMAQKFGPLLTQLREQEREIGELEHLVQEVEDEMFFGRAKNPQEGYQRVMRRRADPEAFAKEEGYKDQPERDFNEDGADAENDSPPLHEVPEAERRELFETFMAKFPYQDIPRDIYEKLYRQFEEEVFGKASTQKKAPPGAAPDFSVNWRHSRKSDSSSLSRLKEIYRILVRRLHPDRRAHANAEDAALWHEVQEAYAAQNLNRLETLWALTEMQQGSDGQNASLSQLQSAVAELKRGLKALQNSLRSAKGDPAWGFSTRTEARAKAQEKEMHREMLSDLAQQDVHLRGLRGMIEEAKRPVAAKKAKKKAPKKEAQKKEAAGKAPQKKGESPKPSDAKAPEPQAKPKPSVQKGQHSADVQMDLL